jgi:hypothetical protein
MWAAVDARESYALQRSLHLAEVTARDGDVIDVRVRAAEECAEKKNAAGDASGGVKGKLRR